MLRNLRPVALEELGLDAALTALIDGLQESRPELDVAFTSDADLSSLDETASLTAYRVVQESLTNVMRHAGAARVHVVIHRSGRPGALRIRVTDDGVGMAAACRDGFGLRGMKERLAVLGGRLDLQSSRQEGTVVEAVIPLAGRTAAEC